MEERDEIRQTTFSNRFAALAGRISKAGDRAAAGLYPLRHLLLFLFLGFYLYTTFYRASRKLFWYDELFSLYLSRLPNFASLWNALKQGADYNPPLFYLITRSSESLFGEGQIGTRLPEILGFGIFCLCLYRFVSSRASVLAGFLSMLFPLITSAYYYASEARPYGIVLGFTGIALVTWQQGNRSTRKLGWRLGLFGALLCASLTHTYSFILIIPFAMAEIVRSDFLKRIDWGLWIGLACSSLGVLVSVPQFRALNAAMPAFSRGSMMANSYISLLGSSSGVLAAGIVLYSLFKLLPAKPPSPKEAPGFESPGFESPELVVLLGLIILPFFVMLLSKVGGVTFYFRYAISSVAGFSCLFGILAAKKPSVGLGVLLCLAGQIAVNQWLYSVSDYLSEPSLSFPLSTRAEIFGKVYQTLDSLPDKTLSIVPMTDPDFSAIMHYAPADLASRMVKVIFPNKTDFNGELYRPLHRCCGASGKVEELSTFLATHDSFIAQCTDRSLERLNYFILEGAELKIQSASEGNFLVLVNLKKKHDLTAPITPFR